MSVRIVRAAFRKEEKMPSEAWQHASQSTIKVVSSRIRKAQEHANSVVAGALREREEILKATHDEAKKIAKDAYNQAKEAAQSEMAGLLLQARIERDKKIDDSLAAVMAATQALAERVISHALRTDTESLVAWAKEAMQKVKSAPYVTVFANTKTLEQLRLHKDELTRRIVDQIDFVVDASLDDTQIRIKSNLIEVTLDAKVQTQTMLLVLRDTFAQHLRSNR
jgi:flagellar biosynthesis/type III secretory pathway protein FliH